VQEVASYWVLATISEAPSVTIYLDDSESQILSPDSFYAHPDYPMDSCVRWSAKGSLVDKGLVCLQEGIKRPLLSTGEHGYPVLGHPNPAPKSLCPGFPRMVWESTPYLVIFFFWTYDFLFCICEKDVYFNLIANGRVWGQVLQYNIAKKGFYNVLMQDPIPRE
jgi:hypothetical protein